MLPLSHETTNKEYFLLNGNFRFKRFFFFEKRALKCIQTKQRYFLYGDDRAKSSKTLLRTRKKRYEKKRSEPRTESAC